MTLRIDVNLPPLFPCLPPLAVRLRAPVGLCGRPGVCRITRSFHSVHRLPPGLLAAAVSRRSWSSENEAQAVTRKPLLALMVSAGAAQVSAVEFDISKAQNTLE